MTTQTSFTHTAASRPGGAAPGFRPNDNIALDELSLYYAGRITKDTGGFVEAAFDGVAQQAHVGNIDLRYAGETEFLGQQILWGITVNDAPTVQDAWNSTPVWGLPYNRSALAPTPMASTLVDGGLAQRVAGAYVMWNDLLYSEIDLHKGLNTAALKTLGDVPLDDAAQTTSFMPYARVAVTKDWEKHHAEPGAYALSADNVLLNVGPTAGPAAA